MILLSPAKIIAAYLIGRGLLQWPPATAVQWPVTTDMMPDNEANNNFVTVYDTGADPNGRNLRSPDLVEHPTATIRVRGKDDETAKEKAALLRADLLKIGGGAGLYGMLGAQTVSVETSTTPVSVVIKAANAGPLMPMKQEENKRRRVYSFNVRITTEG